MVAARLSPSRENAPPMTRSATLAAPAAFAALLLAVGQASAQAPEGAQASAAAPAADAGKGWTFAASAYTYLLPDARDYLQPTLAADRGRLHLEARYNYEDYDTGSAWVGVNFSGGSSIGWEFTPMIGGVVGTTTGIAPAYSGLLYWRAIEFSSEGEFVIVPDDIPGSFFYNWSELSVAPTSWLRLGMVTQRTRAYRTERDIQRGILVGLSYKKLSFTTYVFNPDESRPTIVLAAGVQF